MASCAQTWVWSNLVQTLVLVAGCASFDPKPMAEVPFRERAQTQVEGGVTVSVAVPGPNESRQIFGVDVAGKGIQPVWVEIDNDEDREQFVFPVGMDPNYFSPQEAAWKTHIFAGGDDNDAIDALFDAKALPVYILPYTVSSGFIYTNLKRGIKYVTVELRNDRGIMTFNFLIDVPGVVTDYQQVDVDSLYEANEIRDVTEDELREYIEALPCCVLGGDRATDGDPMNIVMIGPPDSTVHPFIRQGWDVTETITGRTAFATAWSSVFGSKYKTSPVSPLYLYDRPQDVALQKARGNVDERNHLRLWLTPLRYEGMKVLVGQISRDIGVRLSSKTFVTHKIDPDVDEARYYLVQDLITSGSVAKLGHAKGVGLTLRDQPRYNYTLDPYYTDGLRVVLVISGDPVPFEEMAFFPWPPWDDPVNYVDQFRGEGAGAGPVSAAKS